VLKALAPLGLAVLLGVRAADLLPWSRPSPRRLLARPELWEGKEIRLSAVARAAEEVEADGLRLRVRGPRLSPGEDVELLGVYRDGVFEARAARPRPSPLVPALVAAWAVWTFTRRFRGRA